FAVLERSAPLQTLSEVIFSPENRSRRAMVWKPLGLKGFQREQNREESTIAEKKRLRELSALTLLFCFMVLWSHCSGQPITVLDHSSWQYGLMICLQRLTFASVSGFFFLSGVQLTLSPGPLRLGRYYGNRIKSSFLPYLLAVPVYY